MEGPERILSFATDQFLRYGVRNVTMDDIAQQLGMSKKTIYQHFANKEELIMAVAQSFLHEEQARSEELVLSSANAIDELITFMNWSVQSLRRVSPAIIVEVRRFYPQAWNLFEEFTKGFMLTKVIENLRRGTQEGLYRQDLDIEVVARLRIMQIYGTLQQEFFPAETFDPARVQIAVFELYLRGLVSDEGREVLTASLSSSKVSTSD